MLPWYVPSVSILPYLISNSFELLLQEKDQKFEFPELFGESKKKAEEDALAELKSNYEKRTYFNLKTNGVPSWFSHG